MKIIPKGNWVLIAPCEFDTGSMLIDPDISKDAPDRGIVLAIGPTTNTDELTGAEVDGEQRIEVGETVLFGKYSGTPVEKEIVLVRGSDIIARVDGAKLKVKQRIDAMGAVVEATPG